MTYLSDLMDLDLLKRMQEEGYIRTQSHPTEPLMILNYTEKAVYERIWNPATMQCRGLIVNYAGRVVARPFPKFFNYGEFKPEDIPAGDVSVYEKLDGSLGILYPLSDGSYAVATRGSFTSEQAQVATMIWQSRFEGEFTPCEDCTYLVEIIYSSNRIVVDYGDREDLVLLDILETDSGYSYLNDEDHQEWPGDRAVTFPYRSLTEVLAAPQVPNAEGFVVRFDDGTRMKVKFEDYVRLHAIVTNTSSRTVWEALSRGQDISALFENVPDEFRDWVEATAMELEFRHDQVSDYINDEYDEIRLRLDEEFGEGLWTRKDFAAYAKANPYSGPLFMRHDGRPISDHVWKMIRPERTLPFKKEIPA